MYRGPGENLRFPLPACRERVRARGLLLREIPRERPRDRPRHRHTCRSAAFAAATSTFSIAASVRADSANVRPRNACATSAPATTLSCARFVRRSSSSARFGRGDLGGREAFLEHARELLVERRAHPRELLRRKDRVHAERAVVVDLARLHERAGAVAQAVLLAQAHRQGANRATPPRIWSATAQRRVVRIEVAHLGAPRAEDRRVRLVRRLEAQLGGRRSADRESATRVYGARRLPAAEQLSRSACAPPPHRNRRRPRSRHGSRRRTASWNRLHVVHASPWRASPAARRASARSARRPSGTGLS